ncbi:MAG: nitroreductase family protein, partial [Vicinamibacterales bacterium]
MPRFVPLAGYVHHPPDVTRSRAKAFREALEKRRTVREFSNEPVPREVLDECLWAAGTAPSGANLQPWQFVVVTDP